MVDLLYLKYMLSERDERAKKEKKNKNLSGRARAYSKHPAAHEGHDIRLRSELRALGVRDIVHFVRFELIG